MAALARLGCFKPIYLARYYMSKGEAGRAGEILGRTAEDLEAFEKSLREIAEDAGRISKRIFAESAEESLKHLDEFLRSMRSKILLSPQGVRLCIYVQPHLEVMYKNLSSIREDLARSLKSPGAEKALKDAEAYLAYIAGYLEDLVFKIRGVGRQGRERR